MQGSDDNPANSMQVVRKRKVIIDPHPIWPVAWLGTFNGTDVKEISSL